jgi:hypothetical protein
MPTKTKDKSPIAIAPALVGTMVKGGLGALTSIGSNLGTEFGQIKDERKAQKAAGEKYTFGKGLKDYGRLLGTTLQSGFAGLSQGVLGTDFGLSQKGFLKDNQPGYEEEKPEYTTNIDPMTGEEMDMPGVTGLAMTGRPSMIKMLTPVKASYSNLKMSAKEAKQGGLMMKISGAESLSPNMMLGDLDKDGKMSGYEQARQDAIDKNMKKQK